ncbi:MAG: long-chain fatty acid--CoA ligase [Bacteroidaceae bacterium]|nr:long-chain fatty acid--CoA ligase [Bacteroidaceae bacterium]
MLNNCHFSRLVYEQARTYGDRVALKYRDYEEGKWKDISWNRFADNVKRVSLSLLAYETGVQENVAVFSQNKPECLFVDFGAYGIRAVTVPFYPTSSAPQIVYMINDARVRFLFVGEQQQYDVAMQAIPLCHTLERIIIFDRKVQRQQGDTLSIYFDEFLRVGETGDFDEELNLRQAAATFSDLANILYTSGTTGHSKGVQLTFGMYHEALRVNNMALEYTDRDVTLNFLPLTHVFERGWTYWGLAVGAVQAVNLRPQDVAQSLREVRPTCMSSVPRFWEKVYQGVKEKIAEASPVQAKIMRMALETGIRCWRDYTARGKRIPPVLAMKRKVYDKMVYSVLRRTLGLEHGNFFPTAGALVSTEVENFVHAVGINMVVGYGLTESTATVTCDRPGQVVTPGSVGRFVDGLEWKIGDNDEILLRGKTITPGYYNKMSTTAQSIDTDGWFHTGDAGYVKDGELFLKERIKDLFKTSNGKYIAPQAIESKLSVDRYIEQAVVVADRRKFVSALIVPSYTLLEAYAKEQGIAYGSREALCQDKHIHEMLAQRIELLQQELASYEKVKHFILLPQPLSIETGELTNTLKVKRPVVYERYKEEINKLYAEAEKQYGSK